jgi:hypothetical protein
MFHTVLAFKIQRRLATQPSLIIAAILSIVIVNMASLHLSIDAAQSNRQDQEHPYYHDYKHYSSSKNNNNNNWFSLMNASLLSSLSLFQLRAPIFATTTTHTGDFDRRYYDWSQSTEYNYRSSSRGEYIGKFRSVRQRLDHSYHQNYVVERQAIQDSIMEQLLKETKIVDADTGRECHLPDEPWIIFTAGVYGKNSDCLFASDCSLEKISLAHLQLRSFRSFRPLSSLLQALVKRTLSRSFTSEGNSPSTAL